jgi:hypothetical protein
MNHFNELRWAPQRFMSTEQDMVINKCSVMDHKWLLFSILFVLLVFIFMFYYLNTKKRSMDSIIQNQNAIIEKTQYKRKEPNGTITVVEQTEETPLDAAIRYDIGQNFDPLIEPSRRPPVDQIPPPWFTYMTNLRTRPYFDKPSLMGVLTKVGNNKDILQLYGVKDDINNYKYNYYAINKDGIKLEVHVDRNVFELNTNDIVRVLGEQYNVTMYPDKFYRYNPYVI